MEKLKNKPCHFNNTKLSYDNNLLLPQQVVIECEYLISHFRNDGVVGSNPISGTSFNRILIMRLSTILNLWTQHAKFGPNFSGIFD